jgi:tRNA(Ile)-lysidine synthase
MVQNLDLSGSVDEFLQMNRRPTAPGTIMVSIPPLLEITSPIIQQALVLRILRYVSYEPWGSIRSEAGRRQKSVIRLLKVLWDAQALRTRSNISFTVGSGVWWKPAFVTKNHLLRTVVKKLPFEDLMWFASRHPSIHSPQAPPSDELRILMTDKLREGRVAWEAGKGPDTLEVLFDRRFLIRFHLDKMPEGLFKELQERGGVVIDKRSPWHLPEVSFKHSKVYSVIHTLIQRERFTWEREWGTKTYIDTDSDWVTINYIRPISSLPE